MATSLQVNLGGTGKVAGYEPGKQAHAALFEVSASAPTWVPAPTSLIGCDCDG